MLDRLKKIFKPEEEKIEVPPDKKEKKLATIIETDEPQELFPTENPEL